MTDPPVRPGKVPAHLQGKVVAIFGFEEEGLEEAKHLREIGVPVIVSLRQGSTDELWLAAGFEPTSIWDAAKRADVFQIW